MTGVQDLIAVPIDAFRGVPRDISFDVYLKLSQDNFAHVFSKTTGLDYKRLATYRSKGVTELHVRREEWDAYQAFISRPASAIFEDPKVPQEKKIATLLNMTEQAMAELFSQFDVREETAKSTQHLIRSYVDLMTGAPNTLALILKLVSHGDYLYYHSIAVAVFSLFIAKATGQFDRKGIELTGLGGFLHDIGYTQLSKDYHCGKTELSHEDWEVVHTHPRIGMNMLAQAKNIPDGVRYIVYQHHEQPSGRGYPNALQNAVIFHPAKIVAVADAFSSLISKRPFRPAYSVEEAIRVMQSEADKYDRSLVGILASVFLRQAPKSEAA